MGTISEFVYRYSVESGLVWATLGAISAVMFGGIGSARGLRITGSQAAGVLSEKPELFGKLLILVALPGTQGFYGFIAAFIIAAQSGLIGGTLKASFAGGLAMMFIGIGMGVVQWRSAIAQGEAAAASINLVAKKPEESGRSILFPALVETYAVVSLLAAILLIFWVAGLEQAAQDVAKVDAASVAQAVQQ